MNKIVLAFMLAMAIFAIFAYMGAMESYRVSSYLIRFRQDCTAAGGAPIVSRDLVLCVNPNILVTPKNY